MSTAFSAGRLRGILARLPEPAGYRVAYSGGLDSLVLLRALGTEAPPGESPPVSAVHVNHGLQPEAPAWEAHCAEVCGRLGVALEVVRVDARPGRGESPEAAARRARYEALRSVLAPREMLLVAHHRGDQAETVLLQMLRGAGPHGLSGMPACVSFGPGWLARPLLDFPRSALETYARTHGLVPDRAGAGSRNPGGAGRLHWIEDPSNRDPRFERNFLRLEVVPRLRARWPGLERTLGRVAVRQGELARLVDDLACMDLAAVRGSEPNTLRYGALCALPARRIRNVLRAWLRSLRLPVPAETHVEHILSDVLGTQRDRMSRVAWPGAEVRRFGDLIYAMAPLPAHDAGLKVVWRPPEPLDLPAGRLTAEVSTGSGLSIARCREGAVEVRFRRGGERCRPPGQAHGRDLKKLLQERGVPPWRRDRLPLIHVQGRLAAVADLWVCGSFAAAPGEPGWVLHWRERPRGD